MKIMKKIICVVAALSILLAFASCAKDNDATGTDAASGTNANLTKITFALDWTPNTNHTGLYVAKSLGYFEEAGLDVDIEFVDDVACTTLCATGDVQFTIGAQDTLAAAFVGDDKLPITAIAAILQHNTSCLMSRKGDGITTPAGLCGKTYSTWDSPIELATLKALVEEDGGNWDEVKTIPNTITDEPAALAQNDTDAIWVFYGWGVINAEVEGVEVDTLMFSDEDEVFDYYTPVIVGNNEYMEQNPEITKAFLAACKKGYEYAAEHPEEAAQILIDSDDTGSLKGSEELVSKSQAYLSTQYIADAESWGVIDATRWNNFYNWLNENNLAAETIPENTGFTNEYLS